jgi:hypothetical protein
LAVRAVDRKQTTYSYIWIDDDLAAALQVG